jgi:hypothetical protein
MLLVKRVAVTVSIREMLTCKTRKPCLRLLLPLAVVAIRALPRRASAGDNPINKRDGGRKDANEVKIARSIDKPASRQSNPCSIQPAILSAGCELTAKLTVVNATGRDIRPPTIPITTAWIARQAKRLCLAAPMATRVANSRLLLARSRPTKVERLRAAMNSNAKLMPSITYNDCSQFRLRRFIPVEPTSNVKWMLRSWASRIPTAVSSFLAVDRNRSAIGRCARVLSAPGCRRPIIFSHCAFGSSKPEKLGTATSNEVNGMYIPGLKPETTPRKPGGATPIIVARLELTRSV